MAKADTDRIIIAGGGPVGLFTAYRLAKFGIPSVLLEELPKIEPFLKASTWHPPTLDMLDEYGLAAPLVAQGLVTPTWQTRWHAANDWAKFDLSAIADETKYPHRLQCEQHRLSWILLEAAKSEPLMDVRLGAKFLRFEEHDDHVVAIYEQGGEEHRIAGRYLVGADGAKSPVREQLGWILQGDTYPETTVLATTTFPFHEHLSDLSNVNYFWGDPTPFSLLRLPHLWRCSLYPWPGETVEDAQTMESIQKKLNLIVPTAEPKPILEIRPYRIHRRIADEWRKGRIILAGDAAHLNSPSGGMGVNGGIHDAHNLSEKLARVWKGEDERLLDLYWHQRRPIALEEIIKQADYNRRRMQEADPEKRRALLDDLKATAADPVKAKKYLMRTSMIDGLRASYQIQ